MCDRETYIDRRHGHIRQRVGKQSEDVLGRKAMGERIKEDGRDSEGEAIYVIVV